MVLFFPNIRKGEWLAAGTYHFTPWYPLQRDWVSQYRSAFSGEGKNLCPIPDSNPRVSDFPARNLVCIRAELTGWLHGRTVWVSRWSAASLSRLSTTWRPTMPLWQAIHLSWPIYDWVSKMNSVVCQAWLPMYFLPFLMHATYTIYLHQVGRPNIYRWIEQVTREIVFTHTHGHVGISEVSFGALNAVFLVNMTVTDFQEN